MKKKQYIFAAIARVLMLLTLVFILAMPNRGSAQANFVSSSGYYKEIANSTGGLLDKSACDVKCVYPFTKPMKVWLGESYTSASGTLGWDDSNSHRSSTTLHNSAYLRGPGIALVNDGTTWWALVVYFEDKNTAPTAHQFVLDMYEWAANTFTYSSETVLDVDDPGIDWTININSDINNNFVITWNDDDGFLNGWAGFTTNTGPHLVGTSPQVLYTNYSSVHYISPDVSIYANDPASPEVYISYVTNPVGVQINVDQYSFSSTTGLGFNSNMASFGSSTDFYPRIACAPYNSTYNNDDWTVVWFDN